MKLYCSNGSPFARKVRIVLAEKGLACEVDIQDRLRPVEEATVGVRPHRRLPAEDLSGVPAAIALHASALAVDDAA